MSATTRLRDSGGSGGPGDRHNPAIATGIGSLPGEDVVEAVRVVAGELPDVGYLPELPARGAPASMVGRAVALLAGLGADLQPAGWRLTDAPGVDQRRARSLLGQDLDALEEHAAAGIDGASLDGASLDGARVKVQVAGPWTLAASVERPRGDRLLADYGARRDLAQSLAEGVRDHVADVARRVPGAAPIVQLDEPALPAVLAGAVPTASGFSRHREVDVPAAAEALGWLTEAVRAAGATPVVHVCAADVPVDLLVRSGFAAIAYDLSLARPDDAWAAALEAGVDLWPGVVPSTDPEARPSAEELAVRIRRFLDKLGYDTALADRLVVTPTCGLAGASPAWSREAMRLARDTAAQLAPA